MPVVHVMWLVASVVVPLAFVWVHRTRPAEVREVLLRLVMGVAAGAVILVVPLVVFACACGAGNNPIRQAVIPSLGAAVSVAFIGPARLRALMAGALLVCALGLSWQFHRLVLPPEGAPCRFTGDRQFVRNSCPTEKLDDLVVGDAWYTKLTGLHPVHIRDDIRGR